MANDTAPAFPRHSCVVSWCIGSQLMQAHAMDIRQSDDQAAAALSRKRMVRMQAIHPGFNSCIPGHQGPQDLKLKQNNLHEKV